MDFRKRLTSDQDDESSIANPSVTSSESSSTNKSALGKRKFRATKKQFIALLDAYEEGELGRITFRKVFCNSGLHVTHDDAVKNDDW